MLLTATDVHGEPVAGMEPSTWWTQIKQITITPTRPSGIKGSPKLLSKNACRCLAHAAISQCSCPWCTMFLENLDHRNLAVQCGWRKKAGAEECKDCNGECSDVNGVWQTMSRGLIPFTKVMLCPSVTVPGVVVYSTDPFTGIEIPDDFVQIKMIRKECWYGECSKCGWDNRFANFPLLPLTIKEDDESSVEVSVRACPREARVDVLTTYHEFLKMERPSTKDDGSAYTQPEWTPVVANRRLFYYRLKGFMETFLPHYYKVLWHEAFDEVFKQVYKRQAFLGMPDQPQPPASMIGELLYP